jgi:hypothetical protein
MIVCGFVFIILLLSKPYNKNAELYEAPEEETNESLEIPPTLVVNEEIPTGGGECSMATALSAFISIPSIVQKNIVPAIDHLVNSTNDESESTDLENSKSITSGPYAQNKDKYVGTVEMTVETDSMGQKIDVAKFTLDQKLFNKMKTEYKSIDDLFKILQEGNPDLYNKIIK